ncbi:MAG TPA: hemerythrin domain-containing protein [Bryobacteraceae bacterium]|nr:hemerythrin domain-containing protein [Bryobacteraceae bacterium]
MPVQIGQKRESDFSDPLGLLSDCHRRIERFLAVLVKVSERARGRALDPEERAAFMNALEYFRNSAPKHTADEEDSLFPRLRAQASLDCLAELETDHQTADRNHQRVDALGRRWLADGALTLKQAQELNEALARLSRMYTHHIAVEDQELFPLAARLLPADQLAEVGREMAERRKVAHK